MAKKLLSSNNCDCGCNSAGNIGPSPGGGGVLTPDDIPIIVRSVPGIEIGNVINAYMESGKKIYELDDLALVLPGVVLTNNAPVATEIGVNIGSVTFNGNITQGTYPIASRTLTPNPGGLDLTAPFSFNKINVKRTSPGIAELHTLQAIDDQGNSKTVTSGVTFKFAFYRGYSDIAVLDQTQIKALIAKTLNDSILQEYGGQKSYTVPNTPSSVSKYIFWCGPVGTTGISGAMLNGLTLPLTTLPVVNVTNANDGAIVTPYWVKRTTQKFDPGIYNNIVLS